MNLEPLKANLRVEEGSKPSVYDDATGAYIRPGTRVRGNPTIGVGINIGYPAGLTDAEIDYLLSNRVFAAYQDAQKLPYFSGLNDARKLAVVDMTFNMGLETMQTFTTFGGLMAKGDYAGAAEDLAHTKWDGQVGARADRLEQIIRTGEWVTA